MSKIDPRLKFLKAQKEDADLVALESDGRFGLQMEAVPAPRVRVLAQISGDPAAAEKKGLEISSIAGDVVAGMIDLDKVSDLARIGSVARIESSRPLTRELDVSLSEVRANLVHTGPPGHRGTGVIIGIIDTGIDWQHQSFRRQDGKSRILRIWDQSLNLQGTEHRPPGFTYGVEYTNTDIDAAISSANPLQVVRHQDRDPDAGHGTHVAGIAAGDGSIAGNGQPAFTYVGVAPEADIILVANSVTTEALGDSASTLDAVAYIFNVAATLNRPAVINLSQGDNLGPHDGTSLLERGIDNLLGAQGRAFVKSAGNEGSHNRHASGTVTAGATQQVRFNIPTGDTSPDTIDIWYPGADRFAFTITPPGGNASATVNPGSTRTFNLPNGNSVFVDSVLNDPNNNDNRIYVQLSAGTAGAIQTGNWTMNLTGVTVTNGNFHAWAERGGAVPRFLAPHLNNACTISIPGTAREVITAGSYVTKGTGVGSASSFSSRGPTRDGRNAPTIAAPGEQVMSTRAQGISFGTDQYHLLAGTSMSAPHVTGTIALMLQANPNMTQAAIRDCLTRNARTDAFTGATPNTTWGAGKLDTKAAFDCASPPKLKIADEPIPTIKFRDEPEPTLKFRDEPEPTLKFRDEPEPTLKFRDEPEPTLKFRDEPQPTLKFRDEPGPTLKFSDEPGTLPTIDRVKSPDRDKRPDLDTMKRPGTDVTRPPVSPERPGESAPFALATPHHSMAWTRSYPEAFAAMLEEYEGRLAEYERALADADAMFQQGQLTSEELQQADALYQEYMIVLAEYQSLSQSGQAE